MSIVVFLVWRDTFSRNFTGLTAEANLPTNPWTMVSRIRRTSTQYGQAASSKTRKACLQVRKGGPLRESQIVIGYVDTYKGREEL